MSSSRDEEPSISHQSTQIPLMETMESTLNTIYADNEPSTSASIEQSKEDALEVQMEHTAIMEEFLLKSKTVLLDYEKHMFLDLIDTDGLVVCAKGVCYERVVLNLLQVHCDPGNLVLVINSADYEEKFYRSQLDPKLVHESSTNGNERELVYLLGGIHFISTRILVVDLLRQRIPIQLITGIIVLRAHQIVESCQEAFALRLYRQNNKTGFVKAFTNSVEAFTYGYGHVEKVMRNLFIKELYIWPRFHMLIRNALKEYEPTVIELHIPMTQRMTVIQTHILDIMNYLVKEIKRINRFIDMQEITVENCVTKRFHKILQAQLDSVWHQLNSQTKVLISDLKVLRSLMISTIYSDSVSLYATMRKYRTQEYAMSNSGWILLDAAEQIFKTTKDRVFNSKDEFEPENCPKWEVLSEILRVEIPSDIRKFAAVNPQMANPPPVVLILCQDSRTCYQLNQFLTQGSEKYLLFTAMKNDIVIKKFSKEYQKIKDAESALVNTIRLRNANNVAAQIPVQPIQKRATLKAKLETSMMKTKSVTDQPSSSQGSKHEFIKDRIARRKEAEDIELGQEENEGSEVTTRDELTAITSEDISEMSWYRESYVLTLCESSEEGTTDSEKDSFDVSQLETGQFESFAEMENLDITQMINNWSKPIVCIQTFKTGEDGPLSLERTLNDINPRYIIMYHSNVSAIRQIEVFEARRKRSVAERLKVFFMIHAQTVEEQSYLTTLRREKQAFELMIETKSKMVVPEYQDGKSDDSMITLQKVPDLSENTRKAGGQEASEATLITPKIIVDIREFRSDLPCLIHRRGIEVMPVTITIGDYILTPDICVERKSISDLIGSLNSGRLYTQCVQMTRYYKKAILLIEFDQNKPFHLQGHYMISGEASTSNVDITQKLQLLTIHFPKLRLVWSPSPYATAQLFDELKQGRAEPDAAQAAALGSDETTKEMDNIVDKLNTGIYDFLLKLPGITTKNIGRIMTKVANLKELIKLSEVQLADLLDSHSNAKMLWEILHVKHKAVEEANEKQFTSKFKRGKGRRF